MSNVISSEVNRKTSASKRAQNEPLLRQIGTGPGVHAFVALTASIIAVTLIAYIVYNRLVHGLSFFNPIVATTVVQLLATIAAAFYAWRVEPAGSVKLLILTFYVTILLEPYLVGPESLLDILIYTPPILILLILAGGLVWKLRIMLGFAVLGAGNYLAAILYAARRVELLPQLLPNVLPLTGATILLSGLIVLLWQRVTDVLMSRANNLIRERELLLREAHHRVKNSLQTISTLLDMQRRNLEAGEAERALANARDRISAVATVHEAAHRKAPGSDLYLSAFLSHLVESLRRGYAGDGQNITVEFNCPDLRVSGELPVPLSLTINELVTNAVQHGFRDGRDGTITVRCDKTEKGTVRLSIADSGEGLPEEFDPRHSGSLGMTLVHAIVEDQLRGTVRFENSRGTTVAIELPEELFYPK